MVTAPTKRLVPVAELSLKVPVIEEVPSTSKLRVESWRVPDEIVRLPVAMVLPPKVAVPPAPDFVR